MHDARDDEAQLAGRRAADERHDPEDRKSDHDDELPAEDVGQPARGDHQRADRQHVAADHPLQVGSGTLKCLPIAGNARFSANQSICTISIEIEQAAMTSLSSRENPFGGGVGLRSQRSAPGEALHQRAHAVGPRRNPVRGD